MDKHKSELYFLLFLLLIVLTLGFFLFKPFIYVLILAVVFATVFDPLHQKILTWTGQKKVLAALLSTISVLIVVIIPISFLATQVFQETSHLYLSITEEGSNSAFNNKVEQLVNNIKNLAFLPADFSFDLKQYTEQGLKWFIPHITSIVSNFAAAFVGVFIFLMALYYIFKDGSRLKRAIVASSPLQDNHDEAIFRKLKSAINAVIRGNLGIALIQGALTAIGFLIFNVPNPVLWGSIAAITALIPGLGTALVIVPAALYLFWSGQTPFAIGLIIWGVAAVGLIDNFLGPRLVERGMHIHPFLILLSIFGGLSLFGPLGFILGPLVLSLLFALLDIYFEIHREHISQ
ncbi:MAG: AI-2E family transporter [Patescibacteria group bacterium]